MLKKIFSWFNSLWEAFPRFFQKPSRPFKTIKVPELPEQLKQNTVYLVGEGEFLWHALMLCPCGCKEKIYTSLIKEDKPRWIVTEHSNGTVSLHPSVWRTKGCKSHFFLRKGYVQWVNS